MSWFSELRNRNVFRVVAAYIVAAWLVIQVAETILPAFGFGDAAVRAAVIVLVIGLIPVTIFSWLFELTPDGLKREGAVDHSHPSAVRGVKRLDRAIIVILTLAVGFFAFDKFVLEPVRQSELELATAERVRSETLTESFGDNSIAVLPFVNMSDDADNEYFSDGMSEEILNLLARVKRLRVISQSSSFSFKGKQFTIPEVARQLNVTFVLEGSVRKFGQQVRITAQLIDARSDSHMWSETYDRTLEDVFAVQDEISAAIVGELKSRLGDDIGTAPKASGTSVAAAHDAYLRGRYLLGQRRPGTKAAAVAEFESAISLDPTFAQAQAQLAIALLVGGCGDVKDSECRDRARPHAEQAQALAPELAEVQVAMGWLSYYRLDPEGQRAHFQRALKLNPNYAEAYIWMANLGLFPSQQDAFAARETAARLDPLSPLVVYSYIGSLMIRGRLAEVEEQIDRYATIDSISAQLWRGNLHALGGNWSSLVLAYFQSATASPEGFTFSWAAKADAIWAFEAIGLPQEASRMANGVDTDVAITPEQAGTELAQARARAEENPESIEARWDLAQALADAGQFEEALPLLEECWHFVSQFNPNWGFAPGLNELTEGLVAALRNAGDEAEARRVLAQQQYRLRQYREAGIVQTTWGVSIDYFEGIMDYLAGDREKGLELMARGAMDGYYVKPPAVYQRAMYLEPGFAAILERQRNRQAREQRKLLAVVCNNNPYASVWQPASETCSKSR
jgi:TolB-like protein/Tfp pilus assembly protein PilF